LAAEQRHHSDLDFGVINSHHKVVPLSKKHCRILCFIFEEPTRSDIRWDDFIALCKALGATFPKPGRTAGSRRRILLNGRKGLFHAPHPRAEMKEGSVESARVFLVNAGVTPQTEGCEC
jgi:hypothetical protein